MASGNGNVGFMMEFPEDQENMQGNMPTPGVPVDHGDVEVLQVSGRDGLLIILPGSFRPSFSEPSQGRHQLPPPFWRNMATTASVTIVFLPLC